MKNQVTEDTKTPERNTRRGFITRVKDPATVVAAMVTLVLAFGGGVMTGAAWFVTPEVEALRGELIPTALIIDLKSPNLSFRWT